MASLYLRRFIAVVRPAVRAAINTRLLHASFDATGGDKTFTVPLRTAGDATNTIVGYWCGCAATNAMLTALAARLTLAGATAGETSFIPRGAPLATVAAQRMFCFDAADRTPEAVLAFLNVDRLAATVP